MTGFEKAIVISLAVLGVMSTRFLPFLIFRPTPPPARYLGEWLDSDVFGLLVVYCFRQTISTGDRLIPMLAATLATVVYQLRWHSMILSMSIGTALYMILIRLT